MNKTRQHLTVKVSMSAARGLCSPNDILQNCPCDFGCAVGSSNSRIRVSHWPHNNDNDALRNTYIERKKNKRNRGGGGVLMKSL